VPTQDEQQARKQGYWRATWIAALTSFAMIVLAFGTRFLSLHTAQLIGTVGGLLGVGLFFKRYYKLEVPALRPSLAGAVLALLFGVALGIFGTGTSTLIQGLTEVLFSGTGFGQFVEELAKQRQDTLEDLLFLNQPTMIPLVLLVVALAPGICEEFVYRGVVPAALNEPRTLPRVAFIGFLFALVHIDPFSFFPLIAVGALLQLFAESSGGWTSSAFAHFALNAFNGVVFARLYGLETPPVLLAALMSVGGAGLALLLLKYGRR
jgi:membrane protease YdiL (CAAX protease family)